MEEILTLKQEIEKLEAKIEGYEEELNIAIHERNDTREERFCHLINQARVQLLYMIYIFNFNFFNNNNEKKKDFQSNNFNNKQVIINIDYFERESYEREREKEREREICISYFTF